MKTEEELLALKKELEELNKKLAGLSDEELKVIAGGLEPEEFYWNRPAHYTPIKPKLETEPIFESISDKKDIEYIHIRPYSSK